MLLLYSEETTGESNSRCTWSERIGRTCFRTTFPDLLHGAPPADARAAFTKESRMKFVNTGGFDQKSGCTLGRTWAPFLTNDRSFDSKSREKLAT
jgi:hypothetical protein